MQATQSIERLVLLGKCRDARERGVAFVLRHLGPDGALGDPSTGFSYYRAPWTLSAVGRTDAAAAVCAWIRGHLLTADRRLDGPTRVFSDWWTYRDATLIVGAQAAHQYDLSLGLLPEFLRWRDPATGLFSMDRLPNGLPSDTVDLTAGGAGCGFALLATGRLDDARHMARTMGRFWDLQPALPGRFYHAWSRSRSRLITEDDEAFQPDFVVDNERDAAQWWFLGGICAAFLARLHQADPDPEWLALARRYQGFSMAATDAQFRYPAVCKSSWGSALLWQLTGEPVYEAWTYRMADWYVSAQEPDGHWHPLIEETLGDVIEITLEFVMHLDTLIGALASRSPEIAA